MRWTRRPPTPASYERSGPTAASARPSCSRTAPSPASNRLSAAGKGDCVMRVPRGRIVLFTASLFLALSGLPFGAMGADLHPPATRAEAIKEQFASVEVNDPYRWLEDQKAPET